MSIPAIKKGAVRLRGHTGYLLPPVMFIQEEATALLTASKLVDSKTDAGIRK